MIISTSRVSDDQATECTYNNSVLTSDEGILRSDINTTIDQQNKIQLDREVHIL
jgi:hypothetical protein